MAQLPRSAAATTAGVGWRGLAPKLLGVIGMLVLLTMVLTAMALQLMANGTERTALMERWGNSGALAARTTNAVLGLARSVEYLPLELAPADRAAWEKSAAEELASLEARLRELDTKLVVPANRERLAKVRVAVDAYRPIYQQVQALSREGRFEEATKLVLQSSPLVHEIRIEMRGIVTSIMGLMEADRLAGVAEAGQATWTMLGLAIGGSLLAITVSLWIVLRGVTGPLSRLSQAADALAAGRLDNPTPALERRDEVGAIARGLEALRGAAQHARVLEAEARATEEQAAAAAREGRHALATRVENQLGTVMATLGQASKRLETNITALAGTADDAMHRSASVASAAGQASTNVQTVSSAAEELAASVTEITRQVSQAATVARQAVAEAQAADTTVGSLNEAASRIGVVVQLIGEIASQTNLLALNATIEAARAGDAGKGFAVVASEVKQLAGQTGKATEEISQQIAAIQEATGRAVLSIRGIAGVVNEVDQIAASIAAAVEQQGAATQEIARSVSEAAIGTDQVSTNITHVSQNMVATRDALSEMRLTSDEVAQQNATLQSEMETLTRSLRAA